MYPIYFPAALKTEDGKLLEKGSACISEGRFTVDFINEFVPLLKLDTPVQIVRMLGDQPLNCFVGNVYLSSRNLLQIVSVDETALREAWRLFAINTQISASFALSPNHSPHINYKKAEKIDGSIRYISADTIKISAMQYIAEGEYLMIAIEEPIVLKKLVVQVTERVLIGRNAALLLCKIVSMHRSDEKVLADYAELLAKQLSTALDLPADEHSIDDIILPV